MARSPFGGDDGDAPVSSIPPSGLPSLANLEEDGDEERPRPQCVECSAVAPPTKTRHTLISSKFGWRLASLVDPNGVKRYEWRCPACWLRHKARVRSGFTG